MLNAGGRVEVVVSRNVGTCKAPPCLTGEGLKMSAGAHGRGRRKRQRGERVR